MASPKQQPSPRRSVRIAHAETRATRVLEDCGIRDSPVPVEQVALRLGLHVERAALGDDVSGLLVVQDGHGVIGVSTTQPLVRQRFTIAHEIGHFLLHRDAMSVFIDKQFLKPYLAAFRDATSSTGEDRMEREANAFAAALLMPAGMVFRAISELGVDIEDEDAIEELATRFHVSRQAMTFRVANLERLAAAAAS